MNYRENMLKCIRFERPEYIPMTFHINDSCWFNYPQEALFDLMEAHKFLFPDFHRPEKAYIPECAVVARKDSPFTDDWGCLWETTSNGITGTVTKHPLQDWSFFEAYKAPNPETCTGIGPIDWAVAEKRIKGKKLKGEFTSAGLRHGHTFLQLCDIRGYQNLIYDMVDEEPDLVKLMGMIEEFNLQIIEKYVAMGIDMLGYAEDLGMQKGPMLSPAQFRKYISPSYKRLTQPAREAGTIIHMHSDGQLHELLDDIISCGIDVMNLQDLVNGIDWIAGKLAGKICIELDIDRQRITPLGTPADIDKLIREEVEKLGSRQGGLMMIYGLYPGVPLDNIKALMDAMEKYAFYY